MRILRPDKSSSSTPTPLAGSDQQQCDFTNQPANHLSMNTAVAGYEQPQLQPQQQQLLTFSFGVSHSSSHHSAVSSKPATPSSFTSTKKGNNVSSNPYKLSNERSPPVLVSSSNSNQKPHTTASLKNIHNHPVTQQAYATPKATSANLLINPPRTPQRLQFGTLSPEASFIENNSTNLQQPNLLALDKDIGKKFGNLKLSISNVCSPSKRKKNMQSPSNLPSTTGTFSSSIKKQTRTSQHLNYEENNAVSRCSADSTNIIIDFSEIDRQTNTCMLLQEQLIKAQTIADLRESTSTFELLTKQLPKWGGITQQEGIRVLPCSNIYENFIACDTATSVDCKDHSLFLAKKEALQRALKSFNMCFEVVQKSIINKSLIIQLQEIIDGLIQQQHQEKQLNLSVCITNLQHFIEQHCKENEEMYSWVSKISNQTKFREKVLHSPDLKINLQKLRNSVELQSQAVKKVSLEKEIQIKNFEERLATSSLHLSYSPSPKSESRSKLQQVSEPIHRFVPNLIVSRFSEDQLCYSRSEDEEVGLEKNSGTLNGNNQNESGTLTQRYLNQNHSTLVSNDIKKSLMLRIPFDVYKQQRNSKNNQEVEELVNTSRSEFEDIGRIFNRRYSLDQNGKDDEEDENLSEFEKFQMFQESKIKPKQDISSSDLKENQAIQVDSTDKRIVMLLQERIEIIQQERNQFEQSVIRLTEDLKQLEQNANEGVVLVESLECVLLKLKQEKILLEKQIEELNNSVKQRIEEFNDIFSQQQQSKIFQEAEINMYKEQLNCFTKESAKKIQEIVESNANNEEAQKREANKLLEVIKQQNVSLFALNTKLSDSNTISSELKQTVKEEIAAKKEIQIQLNSCLQARQKMQEEHNKLNQQFLEAKEEIIRLDCIAISQQNDYKDVSNKLREIKEGKIELLRAQQILISRLNDAEQFAKKTQAQIKDKDIERNGIIEQLKEELEEARMEASEKSAQLLEATINLDVAEGTVRSLRKAESKIGKKYFDNIQKLGQDSVQQIDRYLTLYQELLASHPQKVIREQAEKLNFNSIVSSFRIKSNTINSEGVRAAEQLFNATKTPKKNSSNVRNSLSLDSTTSSADISSEISDQQTLSILEINEKLTRSMLSTKDTLIQLEKFQDNIKLFFKSSMTD